MGVTRMLPGQKAVASKITRVHAADNGCAARSSGWDSSKNGSSQPSALQEASRVYHQDDACVASTNLGALDDSIAALRTTSAQVVTTSHERNFNLFVGAVVVLNVVVIALETDWGPQEGTKAPTDQRVAWILLNSLFIVIFIGEVVVRVRWERSRWVKSPWNWFDAVLVVLAMIDVWCVSILTEGAKNFYLLTVMRLFRLGRLLRMIKLAHALEGVYVMVMAFLHAMKSMFFVGCMAAFGILIYAIFATMMIGRNSAFDDVRINGDTVYDRFGTVYRSMYSLFELMTLEGWEQVARPLVEAQPITFLFIISFIMIFTFGMLNMIVAIVVDKTLISSKQLTEFKEDQIKNKLATELDNIHRVFASSDTDNSGSLSFEELEGALLNNPAIRESLTLMGIPLSDASTLYSVLDWDGNGCVSVKEFIDGLAKVESGTISPWDTVSTNSNVQRLVKNMDTVQGRVTTIEERLGSQGEVLQEILQQLKTLNTNAESPAPKCQTA